MRIRNVLATGVLVAGLLTLTASPALAHRHGAGAVTFFTCGHPGETAKWVKFSPRPSGDTDPWSIQLTIPPMDPTGCAGAKLVGVAGPPPPNTPSFDFYPTLTGPSGGSPRLVMLFSDGGKGELRPLAWVANTWQKPGPTDWDNNGGTCGFRYEQTYAVILGCHPGATVTSVFVVTDSGWLYSSGYTNYIDNISYGHRFITRPGKAQERKEKAERENGERENDDHENRD